MLSLSLSLSLSCVKFNASQHLQTIHNAALIVPGDVNEMHKLHTLHIFYFIFRRKKQRLLIAQSTRSVILCALYIVYIIRYWHLSGHLNLHAAQCKHFKCQFMQLFCRLSMKINLHKLQNETKTKRKGRATKKIKAGQAGHTNNNKLAACHTDEGAR